MARTKMIKKVLFYLTVFAVVLLPFTFETGSSQNIINHISIIFVLGIFTVCGLWGCTKKEFEEITGIDFFSEK